MFSTCGYVFAVPIISNIPRTSGCPTPAASLATTSSNLFRRSNAKTPHDNLPAPHFSSKNFARSILPFLAGGRTAKETEDRSKHSQETRFEMTAWDRCGRRSVDSIGGNCHVAGVQDHARHFAAGVHFKCEDVIRHRGEKLRGAFGVELLHRLVIFLNGQVVAFT